MKKEDKELIDLLFKRVNEMQTDLFVLNNFKDAVLRHWKLEMVSNNEPSYKLQKKFERW